MQITVTLDLEKLPPDRLLAFFSQVGTAEPDDGREFEILRNEIGNPTLAFMEKGVPGNTWTLPLIPLIQAALTDIVEAS